MTDEFDKMNKNQAISAARAISKQRDAAQEQLKEVSKAVAQYLDQLQPGSDTAPILRDFGLPVSDMHEMVLTRRVVVRARLVGSIPRTADRNEYVLESIDGWSPDAIELDGDWDDVVTMSDEVVVESAKRVFD